MHWNDLIGRRIGPYEIIEELGRGGSARVYRAYQDALNRYVAIKVLINESEDRLGFVRRFEREVEVVAQLNHPNIVAVYDSGQVDDLIYLVMQCVTGGTLRQRLGQPMPVSEACAAMIQMARALHHAHTRGIVHRDVKPSNMLIDADEDGRLLLTDFGIAKLHGMRGLTKSGTTIGTPEYMAPEQAESGETDARADVYSLGCVLYETLAGRPPFIGTTPVSVLYQQVHARPDYIRGLNPKVPRELALTIETALAKRPEERFATAESLARALHPFAESRESVYPSAAIFPPASPADASRAEPAERAERGDEPAHALAEPTVIPPTYDQAPSYADPSARGLGAEGLDAIFPEDPEAIAARLEEASAEHNFLIDDTGTDAAPWPPPIAATELLPPVPPPVARSRTAGPRQTIPLTPFKLPSRDTSTRPLDLPLTADGQLDIDALMAQVEPHPRDPMALPVPSFRDFAARPGQPGYALDGEEEPGDWGDWGDRNDWNNRNDGAPAREHSPAELRAALSGPLKNRVTAQPVWRPEPDVAQKRRKSTLYRLVDWLRAHRVSAAVAVLSVLAVMGILLALLIGSVASHSHQRAVPTATVHVALPTETPVPSPTSAGTATASPQQILDQQARAAFRSITLSGSFDGTCSIGNARTSFAASQTIYLNLCVAPSAPSGKVNVVVRQGGTTIRQLTRDATVYAGYWYSYYTYGLAAGTYDMLITYNGGTAADITFTVG